MYQIRDCWKEFYGELDPDRRRELYEAIVRENEDDGANGFRKELMELRYRDPDNKGRSVDRFIWNMIMLPGLLRPVYLIRAVGEREFGGIIRELGLAGAQEWDETRRAAAYWEYRNAAARYLTTCQGPAYAKKLFGTMHSSEEEQLEKTAKDFYNMTVVVPAKYRGEKELELFIRALQDVFRSSSRAAETAWRTIELGKTGKKGFFPF